MADSMLVRFDDGLARQVRERARVEGKSLTAFINDAVRTYMDQIAASEGVERDETRERLARLAVRLADATQAIREKTDVWSALQAVTDCIELVPIGEEKDLDPITWEQVQYSRLNETGGDAEARRMFAQDYAEIEGRDWTWYLESSRSEEEAKKAWLRQRRRYGLPVPPAKVTE